MLGTESLDGSYTHWNWGDGHKPPDKSPPGKRPPGKKCQVATYSIAAVAGNWTILVVVMLLSGACDYPGNIMHGKVLLVGHMGKYAYREYVQPVGHNEHIQYQCARHYRLVGPPGSTCINGTWSPSELPTCQPKRHPHLYYLFPSDNSFDDAALRRASVSPRRFFWASV